MITVKLCINYQCAEGLSEQDSERIVEEIRRELHEWNCDCGDVPEVSQECWVFELDCEPETTAEEIRDWVRMIIGALETKLRRLADDEWFVVLDRKSIWT